MKKKIQTELKTIIGDVKKLIEESREQIAVSVNTTMSMLYWQIERTAISKKPEETILNDLTLLQDEQKLSPDLVFRDPYFLDFLGLKDSYYSDSEKDLESSIIAELQNFITELGSDFAFSARRQ